MPVARVAAQAKINLFLRVGARRDDGYHDVVTMLQLIDLADEVIVRVGGAGRTLHVAGPQLPSDGLGPTDSNLAYRAAMAYIGRAGWPNGFSIELHKHIPARGGLGGGSSDAGAVLRALDALNERPLGRAALLELAGGLGADVPFFAAGSGRALATGRGDELGDLDPLPARDVLLAVPAFGVPTVDAYRWLDEDRAGGPGVPLPMPDPNRRDWMAPVSASGDDEWRMAGLAAVNDFGPVVERRHPQLARIRATFTELGAFMALMSGSGSAVFGIFADVPRLPVDVAGLVMRTRTSTRVVPVEVRE